MYKNCLVLFCAAILSSPVQAVNPNINGFLDLTFVLSDGETDGDSPIENKYDASAEVDYSTIVSDKALIRIDTDMSMVEDDGGFGMTLEQAFLRWKTRAGIKIKAGLFNNPLGWEAEDAPDLYQISHGQLWEIFNAQTDLYGNNLVGALVSGGVTDMEFVGGIVNDLGNEPEENSLLGLARFVGVDNLEVELGLITQEAQAETLVDLNATFEQGPLTLGGEFFFAGEQYDTGIGGTASYQFTNRISGTVRLDNVSYDNSNLDDTTSLTLAGAYSLANNIVFNAEIRMNDNPTPGNTLDNGMGDGELIVLELIATF